MKTGEKPVFLVDDLFDDPTERIDPPGAASRSVHVVQTEIHVVQTQRLPVDPLADLHIEVSEPKDVAMPNKPADTVPSRLPSRMPPQMTNPLEIRRRHLHAVMSGSLFAPAEVPKTITEPLPRPPAHRKWVGAASVLIGMACAGVQYLEARSQKSLINLQIGTLKDALADGSLSLVGSLSSSIGKEHLDAHSLALVLRGEAAMVRHADADPARLERINGELAKATLGDADKTVIDALLSSRLERLAMTDRLRRAVADQAEDGEARFLLADTLARARMPEARAAFEEGERLAPTHLVHLFSFVRFLSFARDEGMIERVLEQMEQVSTDRTWLSLAGAESASILGKQAPLAIEAGEAVPKAHVHRLRAMKLLDEGQAEQGLEELGRSLDAVRGDRRFAIDLCDDLLLRGKAKAARFVLESAKLTGSPADNLRGRILVAEGQYEEGVMLLASSLQSGIRDPEIIAAVHARPIRSLDLIEALSSVWPEDRRLAMSRARLLIMRGRLDEAEEILRRVATVVGPKERAAVYRLRAEIELERGNGKRARSFQKKAKALSRARR